MPTSTCTLGRAQITKLLGQGTNKQQQKHFWAEMDPCLEDCGLPWQTQASSRQDVFQKHATRQSKHKSLIHLSLHNFTLMLSLNVPEGKGKVLVGEKRAHFPKLNQSKPMRKAHWQKHRLYRHNLSHSSLACNFITYYVVGGQGTANAGSEQWQKKQTTGIFKSSGNKTEMFFIRKKVKRKFVEEYLIDRTGRNFKSQFNARRKDLGDVFSTSSKFDQTKRKFRLNSTKFLAERSVQEKFLKMANPSIPTASK